MIRTRLLSFGLVSGTGLALDYAIYAALCRGGLEPEWANVISASCAVSFVFVVSARRIFEAQHRVLIGPFLVYSAYQVVAVGGASWAVGAMTDVLGDNYILGKTAVVPVSFGANFLFMSWLLSTQLPGARGSS